MTQPHNPAQHQGDSLTGLDPAVAEHEPQVLGVDETIAVSRLTTNPDDILGQTDSANAERFSQLFHNIARYLVDRERWVLWNGSRWALDTLGDLKALGLTLGVVRLIRQEAAGMDDQPGPNGQMSPQERHLRFAAASEALAKRQAMVRSAAVIPELQATAADFDTRLGVINCDGQLLVLDDITEKLGNKRKVNVSTRPVKRSDMITYHTETRYNPDILNNPPPLVTDYLNTFIPDEVRQKMIFKALGSCLVGGNQHRMFIIIQGESTTGKTQLAEALLAMLGADYATIASASIFRGHQDDKPRPDILKAVPKRVAIFSEASKAWELHADRVKDLTGGGTITARLMRENEYAEVKPNFTPVLVTNALPKIVGADPALLRRMLVFEFNNRPLIEDPTIRDRFVHSPEVHEWLLARLVQGYVESVEETMADVIVAQGLATMEAFESLTHIGSFFRWLTDTDQMRVVSDEDQGAYGIKSTYVTLKDMYDRYAFWVKEYGAKRDQHEKLDYESFNEQLKNNGWERIKSGSWRWVGKQLISLASWQWQETGTGPK